MKKVFKFCQQIFLYVGFGQADPFGGKFVYLDLKPTYRKKKG